MKTLSDKEQVILVNNLADMSLLTMEIAALEDAADLIAGCKGLEMTANILEMCSADKQGLS